MSGFGNRSSGFGRGRGGDEYRDGMCTYNMFVPAGDCGKIIGHQGTKIHELQDQSRCRIKVSRDDEGDGTRRVELSGSDDAIAEAKELINQILESDDRGGARQSYDGVSGGGGGGGGGGSGSSKEVIQIDSSFVGRIIGKGGSRVHELQDDTGCRINVSCDGGNYGQTDVELIGSRFAIQRAREAIDEITSQAY